MTDLKKREGSILAIVVDEATNSIVFNVAKAAADGGSKSITLDLSKVHPANVAYAALHGFKQRCGDMGALSRNPDTGLPATPADKFAAIERGVLHYMSGTDQWNMRASSERGIGGDTGFLVAALIELKGLEPAKAAEWVKERSAGERRALLESTALKPIVDRMRAEAVKDIDVFGMLETL